MNTNNHYRFLIITVFLVLLALISILIYSKVVNSPIITGSLMTKATLSPTPVKPTYGSMTVKTENGLTRQPLTGNLKLDLLVDSQKIDVVGYDLLLGLDSTAFEVVQAESVLSDFSLFKLVKDGRLIVTGTKKLSSSGPNIFGGEKVVTFTFKPLKTGRFTFQLLPEAGKEKTQLVDTASKIYYPKLKNIEIEIY